MSIGPPIPGVQLFQNLTLKSQGKFMGEVKVEIHNMGPTFSRLISLSLHVNRPSHSSDTAFLKFYLENTGSRSNDYDVAQLYV